MKRFKERVLSSVRRTSLLLQCWVFLLVAEGLIGNGTVLAQTVRQVSGTVIAKEDGFPVIGASVLVEGTNIGTITNVEGAFTITGIPSSAKQLRVSYVGMKTQVLPLASEMKVVLESDAQLVDEVVVVAYGTAKKSTFTGSASVVKTDQLDSRPVTEVSSALLGAVSGVTVNNSTGMPGSSASIRIRGVGSFSASSDPLIILDGIPYEGTISSLNPSDIENITVLKDAASSALYGSRAANGVLMVTTKHGSSGKPKVNIKLNQGFTARQSADYRTVGVADYLELYWENLHNKYVRDGYTEENASRSASANLMSTLEYNPFLNVPSDQVVGVDGKFNSAAQMVWADDTNWNDAIEQLGSRTDAIISVNGGSENTDYYFSAGITDEKGYIIGSAFKRYTAKANINSRISDWLKLGMTTGANISEVDGVQNETRNTYSNPFLFTRYISPLYPIHLHDAATGAYILDANGNRRYDFGTGYDDGTYYSPNRSYAAPANPAIELAERERGYTRRMFNVKGYAEVKFLKDFTFTANASISSNAYLGKTVDKVYEEKANIGSASRTNSFTTTYTYNQLLDYKRKFGEHSVDMLLGHESYKYDYNYLYASMKGEIMTGNSELVNYTDLNATPVSYTNKYRTEGYFMRATYDYGDKYYASASFRRDASSRFYKDSCWGNFWSVGGGWSISREKFLENVNGIDNLKIRFSYGEVGNDNVGGYYPWVASYTPSNNVSEAGYVQSSLGNRNLRWEVSHNFDVGVEFAFFRRLSGSVEYFYRKSTNLLFSIPLSPSTGFDSVEQNTGTMYNGGIEYQLTAHLINGKSWKWDIDLNGTYLKNKITKLPVDAFMDSDVFKIEEGHSRYEFYLKQWEGVDPATGNCIYLPTENASQLVTVNGKEYTTSIDEAAYAYSGSGMPTFTGGFSTKIAYKNWALSASLYYQLGGKLYDTAYCNLMTPNQRSYNTLSTDILSRWQKAGDVTTVPRLSDGSDAKDLIGEYSTRWLVSSDMLELANVVLSYNFPSQWVKRWGIGGLSVYASGENLFQITARKGIYPRQYESGYSNNGDTYAPARVFTAGLNLTF